MISLRQKSSWVTTNILKVSTLIGISILHYYYMLLIFCNMKRLFLLLLLMMCSCEGIGDVYWGLTVINDTDYDFIGILGDFPKDKSGIRGLPQVEIMPKPEEYIDRYSISFSWSGVFRPPKKGVHLYVVDATAFRDVPHSELEDTVFQMITDDMIFATVTITKSLKSKVKGPLHFPDSFETIDYNINCSIAAPL